MFGHNVITSQVRPSHFNDTSEHVNFNIMNKVSSSSRSYHCDTHMAHKPLDHGLSSDGTRTTTGTPTIVQW
jgi:hypothetical protein